MWDWDQIHWCLFQIGIPKMLIYLMLNCLITANIKMKYWTSFFLLFVDRYQLVKMKMMKMKDTMMFRLRPNLPKRVSQKKRFLKFSAEKRISRDIRIGIRHQSYLRQMDFYSHVKEHLGNLDIAFKHWFFKGGEWIRSFISETVFKGLSIVIGSVGEGLRSHSPQKPCFRNLMFRLFYRLCIVKMWSILLKA